jgi:hypothetical protein
MLSGIAEVALPVRFRRNNMLSGSERKSLFFHLFFLKLLISAFCLDTGIVESAPQKTWKENVQNFINLFKYGGVLCSTATLCP